MAWYLVKHRNNFAFTFCYVAQGRDMEGPFRSKCRERLRKIMQNLGQNFCKDVPNSNAASIYVRKPIWTTAGHFAHSAQFVTALERQRPDVRIKYFLGMTEETLRLPAGDLVGAKHDICKDVDRRHRQRLRDIAVQQKPHTSCKPTVLRGY
jgi:hypothetical protein